jgi:hypothetical protein
MDLSKNILVIGNSNYGLSKSISNIIPNCDFISRTCGGFDLASASSRDNVAQISINYDVVLIVSALSQFRQVLLLQSIIENWIRRDHSGYIICVGSSADTPVKSTEWIYPVEKKALRAYCRQLSQIASSEKPKKWKITYLSPGNLHTPRQDDKMPGVKKLNCDYVASVINWLIDQPKDVSISELCLDRIQS